MAIYKHKHTQHMHRMQRTQAGAEGSLADGEDDANTYLIRYTRHGMFHSMHAQLGTHAGKAILFPTMPCMLCNNMAFLLLLMHG